LGGGLFSFPTLSSFSSSFFFPSLAYLVFIFIFILNVGGEYGEKKRIGFSIVAIQKGAHFSGTPLSNFLYVFIFDGMIDA
jgi:hypothetical protein